MSYSKRPGMLARLRSLIGGLFGSWVREREQQSPEVVYEQAIGERVRQYRELKEAVAGILYMRNKLEQERLKSGNNSGRWSKLSWGRLTSNAWA